MDLNTECVYIFSQLKSFYMLIFFKQLHQKIPKIYIKPWQIFMEYLNVKDIFSKCLLCNSVCIIYLLKANPTQMLHSGSPSPPPANVYYIRTYFN